MAGKTSQSRASSAQREGKVCICCSGGIIHPLSEFYASVSPLHSDGLVPICKRCIVRHSFDARTGRIDMDGFLSVLRQMDRPFLPDVLERARVDFDEVYSLERVTERVRLENREKVLEYYFKRLNSSPTYRKYRYADGKPPEQTAAPTRASSAKAQTVTDDMKRFWGPGFTNEDYLCLQNEFEAWAEGRDSLREDKAQLEIAKNLCYGRLQIIHSVVNGENVAAMLNSYNQSLTAGNLKPVEKTAADEKPLGVVIRDIMNYTPADFFRDRSIHKDVDGIESYMQKVIGRAMRNTMLGEQVEDEEFSVTKDDDI